MQFMTRTRRRVIINITSLIDVLFLLLIFFMVSSTFLEKPGMKLDLPKTQRQEMARMEGTTLFLTEDEQIFLNQETVSLASLQERLEAIAPRLGEEGILLEADEAVRYGLVVEVMDMIKAAGIEKLVVATERKE